MSWSVHLFDKVTNKRTKLATYNNKIDADHLANERLASAGPNDAFIVSKDKGNGLYGKRF
jgi:hypothetical protein